ncbi:uncharacterized protein KZ484_010997 [Pholidichthys leucotaenia]
MWDYNGLDEGFKNSESVSFPQHPECKEKDVLAEHHLWNQEWNSVWDQVEPEPLQVKEEQQELCINQEEEQLLVKLEADTLMVTLISEEKQQSEAESNSEQLLSHNSAGSEIQDEEGCRHVDSESTKEEKLKPKKRRLKTRSHSNSGDNCLTSTTLCENETDAPQLHDSKEEKVLTVQQLFNQERNSILDQEEQDAAQVKEEEEELCSSQEEEHFGLKQETDTFMVTPTDEDNDNSETEPNSEQLLSHNSDTESQDQEPVAAYYFPHPSWDFCSSNPPVSCHHYVFPLWPYRILKGNVIHVAACCTR